MQLEFQSSLALSNKQFLSAQTRSLLEQTALSNAISHAYILCGSLASFRDDALDYFEALLHCETRAACGHCRQCQLLASHHHPSAATLIPDGASIKIEQIREMLDQIKYGGPPNHYQTIKIYGAHTLTDQAANALLRTIESPPERVIFILGAPSRSSVIPTIVSRCQIIYCANAPHDIIQDYLYRIQFQNSEQWQLAPNTAISAAAIATKLPDDFPSLSTLLTLSPTARIIATHAIGKSKDLLQIGISKWIEEQWNMIEKSPNISDIDPAITRLDFLVENIIRLRYNLNPRLHLDRILVSL